MTLAIVPNVLRDVIQAAIDKALAGRPIEAEEREHVYHDLLAHFDEHGVIPDFDLKANDA